MPRTRRDRVTVDLRGAGARMNERAAAQGLTTAAFVRQALRPFVEQPASSGDVPAARSGKQDQQIIKVTLRLSAAHAVLLATRARGADVSQGTYVAGLLDDMPPPPSTPARAEAMSALLHSTDHLAAISADLNSFTRLLRLGSSTGLESYRAGVMSLSGDVQRHLDLASRYLAEVRGTAFRRGTRR